MKFQLSELMKALVYQRKTLVLSLVKQTQSFVKWLQRDSAKFCLSLYYNADNSYLFVNGKEIFKFKADNKNVNFPAQFCLGSICNKSSATKSKEISLNQNVYNFSVDFNSIDKCDILNIHMYLMIKNDIK